MRQIKDPRHERSRPHDAEHHGEADVQRAAAGFAGQQHHGQQECGRDRKAQVNLQGFTSRFVEGRGDGDPELDEPLEAEHGQHREREEDRVNLPVQPPLAHRQCHQRRQQQHRDGGDQHFERQNDLGTSHGELLVVSCQLKLRLEIEDRLL